jgi:hypothetical protein
MNELFLPMGSASVLLLALAASLSWVAWDAKRRGRSAVRIVLLCFITWPLGFFIWRSVRPPPPI